MKIINCTPHDIHFCDPITRQIVKTYPRSGIVPRVSSETQRLPDIDGCQAVTHIWGAVDGLPEPEAETLYAVSTMVADKCRGRMDLIVPDSGPTAVRDEKGQIVGVTRWTVP